MGRLPLVREQQVLALVEQARYAAAVERAEPLVPLALYCALVPLLQT